jgi:alkyldihydroxyacetonephosphate synthase
MRRWNGWGDDSTTYPVPPGAVEYLEGQIGPTAAPRDATLEQVMETVPPSRLPAHPLVTTDPEARLRHARGQSLPDWVALRSGRIGTFPDGIAYPSQEEEVRDLLDYARDTGVRLIPYGGGTSVVGHINPLPGEAPVLTVDMSRLSRLRSFDETSHLATFGAGVMGPDLEAQLRARGATLGHFPQSFELSTLGGWVATRSAGQQSYYYGRIEDLFAGGHVETPVGPLDLPLYPASAAGPDLRQLVLGSEGRFGILTAATVRVSPLPERESFHAVFFPGWEQGYTAVREIAQARIPVSMLRLSNAVETETTLVLAGHERLVDIAEWALDVFGLGEEKCLLLFGVTGGSKLVKRARRDAIAIAGEYSGRHVGQYMGQKWRESRFLTPYLRNTLWEIGVAVDTLETALPWSALPTAIDSIQAVIRDGLQEIGERVHTFAHLSHTYPSGASFYVTYLFRVAAEPEETLRRWQILKGAASRVIVAAGGTISHQHGIGTDHLAYLEAEKGPLGMALLETVREHLDPQALMNPGKLLEG